MRCVCRRMCGQGRGGVCVCVVCGVVCRWKEVCVKEVCVCVQCVVCRKGSVCVCEKGVERRVVCVQRQMQETGHKTCSPENREEEEMVFPL